MRKTPNTEIAGLPRTTPTICTNASRTRNIGKGNVFVTASQSEVSNSRPTTEFRWKTTSACSNGRAASARSARKNPTRRCASITAIARANYAPCSAASAISGSDASMTIPPCCAQPRPMSRIGEPRRKVRAARRRELLCHTRDGRVGEALSAQARRASTAT